MKQPYSLIGMIILAFASSIANSSYASAALDAQEVLKAASDAAKKVRNVSYNAKIETSSGKSKRIESGKVLLSRFDYSDTIGARIAVKGDSQRVPKRSVELFEFTYDGQYVRRVIASRKIMMLGHILYGGEGVLSAEGRNLLLEPLLSIDPYAPERKAESIELVGQKEISGILCDVIEVNYKKPDKTSRLFISVEDHLPRAWERSYLSARGKAITSIMTITDLNLDVLVEDSDFQAKLPNGYKLEIAGKAPRPPLDIGDIVPDWTLKDSEGVKRTLSDYRGKVVLLDFWAKWCDNCASAMDTMQAIHEEFEDQGLVFFSINCRDVPGTDAVGFVRDLGYTYPVLLDGNSITVKYHVTGIPAFYIIGPEGRLRYKGSGFGDPQALNLYKNIEMQLRKINQ
ncbi:MAG: redoxin domain-containing protein [Planctomycetes bacterium]|nr:redoxin domain-containing protein [Planctomycetota bacterium]